MDNSDKDLVIVKIVERNAQDRVAFIAINNEKRLNSLNSALMRELIEKVENLGADPKLRVAVLTGVGEKSFIGGADIFELRDLNPKSARDFLTLIHRVSSAVRMLPVPVIARINGYCLGAGLEDQDIERRLAFVKQARETSVTTPLAARLKSKGLI